MKRILFLLLSVLIVCQSARAQEMNSLMFRRPVASPELTENALTFRFRAPKARMVQVSASWNGR